MTGCPYRIKTSEVTDFFGDYGLKNSNVFIELESNERRTGFVLVEFENEEDVAVA